jgi:epoxyqueuosine reductase QueG
LNTAAPFLFPDFRIIRDPARRNFTSTWSERHVSYACGLGTFGLTDALITKGGMAHRLGSVVVNARLPEAARPYSGHLDYCLSSRGCTACVRRCPAGALSRAVHDKDLCHEMVQAGKDAAARRERLGLAKTGYGLCQVGVPCEDRIPISLSP